MGLQKIKEGCWVDESDPYFSINEWWNIELEKVVYYITDGVKYITYMGDERMPEHQLYDRIFLPGKKAIESQKN